MPSWCFSPDRAKAGEDDGGAKKRGGEGPVTKVAGKRFAVLYSLIATCEKHGVNPVRYFTDVLIRIQDHPKSRVAELLPDRWKVSFGRAADEAVPDPPDPPV